MRAQNILFAVLVFSLFSMMLVSYTGDFVSAYNNNTDLYNGTGALNATLQSMNIINSTAADVGATSDKVPGGRDANAPTDSATTDGSIAKSGLIAVGEIGTMLFKLPKLIIGGVGGIFVQLFGLDPAFVKVAITSIIIIIAIILISSVLRNRI